MANIEIINTGSSPNDGSGDPLRVAFSKTNNNFANLWATGYQTLEAITNGNTTQLIWQYPADTFTQAAFQINSSADDTTDSQNIFINASINGALNQVRFTAYGLVTYGNIVTNYDMEVTGGNVILNALPLVEGQVKHFIAYQVTYNPIVLGMSFVTNQDGNSEIITESANNVITTEN
jgi:hypothetical protein